jgi:RHH-type rel operon transcriptional repressor/antitoxin RelB
MALSVRLDPLLESRVEQEARRLGISKSEFVKEALERVLGTRDPYELLKQVRNAADYAAAEPGTTSYSENVSAQVKAKLRAKRSA